MAEQNQGTQGGGGGMQGGGAQGGGTGSTDAQGNPLQSSKTHARAAVDDIRTAATQMAGEYRGKAEEAWGQAQDRVRTFQEDGEAYVRENPTKAVFTALGIGFVLGIIFRR
jgi:ElaB/YqjD/DUF883 family membrane-anchored ribosome-binding protein